MERSIHIDSKQMVALLLVSRFFTMLVAVPNSRYTLEGSDALLAPIISLLLMVFAVIPLLYLTKKFPQQSLHQIAERIAPKSQKLILIWQFLLCIITAIATASQSEYFVATALYPQASRPWVSFFFMLLVWYMISMGIEAISRVALLVCVLIVVSFGLIFSGVFSQIDWLSLTKPFYESTERILGTGFAYWGQNLEILLLLILQPYSRKSRFKQDFFSYVVGGFLITELISFFSAAVLGDYGKTRMFPIYTLASLSGHGFFSRLDYLHIISWTFACLLRAALFAFAAAKLLEELFPKAKAFGLRLVTAGILFICALALTFAEGSFQWFYMLFATGVPVSVTMILIPLFLLWKSRKRRKKQ